MNKLYYGLGFLLLISMAGCGSQQVTTAADTSGIYEIEQITGNLYRGRSNAHYTAFLVTTEGTILADPINLGFAEWLKDELAERFDSEVRYVLYTHHHWDHASGGAPFADTAIYVGHENMATALEWSLPGNYQAADLDGNGTLELSEISGGLANDFDNKDSNGDGSLTGAEVNQDIVAPTIAYSKKFVVKLGDSEVQMIYSGSNHSEDGSLIYFPAEKALFNADLINIKRLPFGLRGKETTPWKASIDVALSLDANIILPGHGVIGNRQDLMDFRQYFDDLREAVGPLAHTGMSIEEIIETNTMDAYKDWQLYDVMTPRNMTEIYERIMED